MYINFDNQDELKNQIEELQPTKGICIFIDICGSTAIKQKSLRKWIILIGNSINLCSGTFSLFRDNVLKLIGDEIMIFIPDEKIKASSENYATVLDFLKTCISSNGTVIDQITLKTKAAIRYCDDTYNISFRKNTDDYYGNGIDLTARLMKMKKLEENKIVLSETFYQLVSEIDPSCMKNISKKLDEQFKGIVGKTEFRIIKT